MVAHGIRVNAMAELGPTAPERPRRDITRRGAVGVALGLAAIIIVVDQLSKAAVTARIGACGNPNFYPVVGQNAGLSYVCNSGTAFSRFSGSPFVWLPVTFAALVVSWLWYRSLEAPWFFQQVAFGLLLGGASGNMIDRFRFGYVVDFVDLRLSPTLRWYVFNVSDAAITCGVIALAIAFWLQPDQPTKRLGAPVPAGRDAE